jgi:flavodoxin
MKSLIVVYSYHHNNTLKIANAISTVLDGTVKTPMETAREELRQYDLIGFGAGIDSGKHYSELLEFAKNAEKSDGKKCFIFSTSGVQGEKKVFNDHKALRNILIEKGYEVIGEFSCQGFDTNSFLKYIGGLGKNHPDSADMENAKQFARELLRKYESSGNDPSDTGDA